MQNEVVAGEKIILHVGVDDTDNPHGDCTTYFATEIVKFIFDEIPDAEFLDYPNLIRLMPNIPYKTRGNAAVAIRMRMPSRYKDKIITEIQRRLTAIDIIDEGTNPAVAFLEGEIPPEVFSLGEKALYSLIPVKMVKTIVKQFEEKISVFSRNGEQGLVGSLAAIGSPLLNDHTFELLTYRTKEYLGTPRQVDKESVIKIDNNSKILTFNNIDPTSGKLLLTPHGPDPILYGVRGERKKDVIQAFDKISTKEPIAMWMVFRSNQGTDVHLRSRTIEKVREYEPAVITGILKTPPERTLGGHVFCIMYDQTGEITIAAYEPSKYFRDVVTKLKPKDEIIASGSIRKREENNPLTLNLEKLIIQRTPEETIWQTPNCSKCQTTLSSMGKDKGYRCPKCRTRYRDLRKTPVKVNRDIKLGLYLPPPIAQRHLTKPLSRYGREKSNYTPTPPQKPWNSFH
ncbi:MAG: TiaS agmantine-binding domain-containing protein [Candidatus Ranarchaeia archaeon]|jgi:tRNA(Ile2)-agmatinylcytidine synthase